ncbi:MAG TPA: ZIP family metal transporter [Flavobacteriaceae bacterium]|nr:ZIP family metal transporter [Flavobacteriaceae bacterium]
MSIILPFLSVVLGFIIALFMKRHTRITQHLLSFSGALLLSVLVFEFLPHVYQDYQPIIGVLVMSGVLLQVLLEFMSKGAEHGHTHADENLKRFPMLMFIGLCIHSFMEGFPIANNPHLMIGVVLHKLPVAIVISTFLLNSNLSKTKIYIFILLFSLMTPLGSVLDQRFITSSEMEHYIEAVVVGILLHVSTTILFESSKNHQFNWAKIISILLGIGLAYLM